MDFLMIPHKGSGNEIRFGHAMDDGTMEKEGALHGSAPIKDQGGRRSGIDRRRFSYAGHIPERRSGKDRREGSDRRSGKDRRSGIDRRGAVGEK
jgi:hypothetical protein